MNNQEITFSGYSAVPSDYESPDGELAAAFNIIPEDDGLKPILQPRQVATFPNGQRPIFIHHTSAGKHIIILSGNNLLWRNISQSNTEPIASGYSFYNVSHCNAIGNTLLIFSGSEITYILWVDNSYKILGNKIPDINISFGLVGHPRLFSQSDNSKDTFTIEFAEEIQAADLRNDFSDSNKSRITEQIMAKLNKFVRQQSIEKGRFCFPFFVRYALRLFDGSLTAHSAPILMNPSTTPAPVVLWGRATGKNTYQKAENCDLLMVAADLDYQILNPEALHNWKDIIKSIDVFISRPLYSYDQNGTIDNLSDTDNFDSRFIGRIFHENLHRGGNEIPQFVNTITEDNILQPIDTTQGDSDFVKKYAEWPYSRIYQLYFSPDRSFPGESFHLPEFSAEKISENITDCASFYKLHSIPIEDTSANTRTIIPIEDSYLQSLVTRELMTDDYLSHDRLTASYSHAYNSRINLAGISRRPFAGFPAASLFAFCNADLSFSLTGNSIRINTIPAQDEINITVFIKEAGKTIAVRQSSQPLALWGSPLSNGTRVKRSWGAFFFYPNVNAFKIAIQSWGGRTDNSSSLPAPATIICDLRPHDFLNGAFCLLDYNSVRIHNLLPDSIPDADFNPNALFESENKIYTSEVNNPFFFPLAGINTVGTGRIRGIASAAKALSQGQFGQFPLYAFTDQGVWALEVSESGTYSARQPITRDVCTNPDSITQIDSAVLFATDRGIMLIAGSETRCITDTIASETPFDLSSLPRFDTLHNLLEHPFENHNCIPFAPFSAFLDKSGILYDYTHQHIILFSTEFSYAYVYSLKSKKWGMIYSDLRYPLNSYPDAYAVTADGALVNFSQPKTDSDNSHDLLPALLVTRPLKLQAPDILKTINSIICRGHFRNTHLNTVLYASRDLFNWHLVWSAKSHALRGFSGTPYKYFRLALIAYLNPAESLSGASVLFSPKLTNKPR